MLTDGQADGKVVAIVIRTGVQKPREQSKEKEQVDTNGILMITIVEINTVNNDSLREL